MQNLEHSNGSEKDMGQERSDAVIETERKHLVEF